MGVRGLRNISSCELVQNSAIRYFLGVHKYAPTLAIVGDMGWESCEARWKICMAQLWNRLLDMDANRLTRKIFLWDKHILGPWSKDICKYFCNYGFGELFLNNEKLNIGLFKESVFAKDKEKWSDNIWTKPKLRIFLNMAQRIMLYIMCLRGKDLYVLS